MNLIRLLLIKAVIPKTKQMEFQIYFWISYDRFPWNNYSRFIGLFLAHKIQTP